MALVILPTNIVNNTTADAAPVMGDLNAILTQVNGGLDTTNLRTNSFLYCLDWNCEAPAGGLTVARFFLPCPTQRPSFVTAWVDVNTANIRLQYSDDDSYAAGHMDDIFTVAGGINTVVAAAPNQWTGAAINGGLSMGLAPASVRLYVNAVAAGAARLRVKLFVKCLLRENGTTP